MKALIVLSVLLSLAFADPSVYFKEEFGGKFVVNKAEKS